MNITTIFDLNDRATMSAVIRADRACGAKPFGIIDNETDAVVQSSTYANRHTIYRHALQLNEAIGYGRFVCCFIES